jgi:ergothioneine biosynthesis protein EgtB
MQEFLADDLSPAIKDLILLGFNHEQQHQELLYTDIKYILGHNPLFPAYSKEDPENSPTAHSGQQAKVIPVSPGFLDIPEGVYQVGYSGDEFCFDNEREVHKVFLRPYKIATSLVTNAEYIEFIKDGGYSDFRHWHAEGWDWVKNKGAAAPLYWHSIEGRWFTYTLGGLTEVPPGRPVTHINFYEASAYAAWKGKRLPLETEWEIASPGLEWGSRWEWTESAYLPYPGFSKAEGAIGEYNGKFMVSQMVLRGASIATPPGHSRNTYRNFFYPHLQWQFTGIRLAQ